MVSEEGKKRSLGIGDQKSRGVGLICPEPLGVTVDLIVQLLDRVLHPGLVASFIFLLLATSILFTSCSISGHILDAEERFLQKE